MKLIDLKGQKFGHLTVIERQGSDAQGHATWLCACDCGGKTVVPGTNLRRGHTVGCGCQQNRLIDEVGNRYGHLTVIERAPSDADGNTQWRCKCKCGTEVVVRATVLRAGGKKSCGCRYRLPEGESGFRELIDRYRRRADDKALEFDLPEEVFRELTQQACHYCGVAPAHEAGKQAFNGPYIYNGLDRLDNSRGYTPDNVVPCCGTCNHAKATLSVEAFKTRIIRINRNFGRYALTEPGPTPLDESAFRIFYSRWKSRAKSKGLAFALGKRRVWEISQSRCYYCGAVPMHEKTSPYDPSSLLIYNGLDRLDNSQGYTPENVVPCCGTCNHAKATLSVDEFRDLVRRIYEHWASKED